MKLACKIIVMVFNVVVSIIIWADRAIVLPLHAAAINVRNYTIGAALHAFAAVLECVNAIVWGD
jgi:hypothetical protein